VAIQTESIKTYSKGSGGESMATEMRKTGGDGVGVSTCVCSMRPKRISSTG
jgi:hypothetical protein